MNHKKCFRPDFCCERLKIHFRIVYKSVILWPNFDFTPKERKPMLKDELRIHIYQHWPSHETVFVPGPTGLEAYPNHLSILKHVFYFATAKTYYCYDSYGGDYPREISQT